MRYEIAKNGVIVDGQLHPFIVDMDEFLGESAQILTRAMCAGAEIELTRDGIAGLDSDGADIELIDDTGDFAMIFCFTGETTSIWYRYADIVACDSGEIFIARIA